MTIYQLYDNSSYEKRWTRSYGVIPRSHVVSWDCADCGRGAEYPAGSFDLKLEGGIAFPDVLGWGAFPVLIVSERVLHSWDRAGIDSFKSSALGVASVQDSDLRPEAAPKYYRVEVTGRCMVDLVQSGVSVTGVCRRCGEIELDASPGDALSILAGSWDGTELFRDRRLFPSVVFCTERIRQIALSERHTNVRFEPTK